MFPKFWCFKDELPTYLAAAAYSFIPEPGPPTRLSVSFKLQLDDSLPGWSGESAPSGRRIILKVTKLALANYYDVKMWTYHDHVFLNDESWLNFFIAPPPGFDSRRQRHVWTHHTDESGFHVIG